MSIPLHLLETFCTFAQAKNIFEAAQKLAISQPSVSAQLKMLEDHFACPLFVLKGKKKLLSPQGKIIFQEVAPSLAQLRNKTKQVQRSFKGLESQTITIAGRKELFRHLVDNIIFPGRFELIACSSREASDKLRSGDVDFALSPHPNHDDDLKAIRLINEGVHFIIPHAFVLKKPTLAHVKRRKFLQQHPCYLYKKQDLYMSQWLRHYHFGDELLQVKGVIDDWSMIIRQVELGRGFALVPDSFPVDHHQVYTVPVSQNIIPAIGIYLLQRKESEQLIPFHKTFAI